MDSIDVITHPIVDHVKLQCNGSVNEVLEGTLCISAFHLIFSTRRQNMKDITVLHTGIETVDKKSAPLLCLKLKDFRVLNFEIPDAEVCISVADSLIVLSQPERIDKLHPFSFYVPVEDDIHQHKYEPETVQEMFTRWGCDNEAMRITDVNKGYKVCESYPEQLIVPKAIGDEIITKSSLFRHHKRFPIVCYYHQNMKTSLLRSGQPKCGTSQNRCSEDIQLLNSFLTNRGRGKVLDMRSSAVLQQHISKGGGTEPPMHYPQWKLMSVDVPPVPSLLQSLQKLIDACQDPSISSGGGWLNKLEASGWLSHVTSLLLVVSTIVHEISNEGNSVLVHGASGRDLTLLVTSLVQVLLDPHCRTTTGFIGLIQREWLDAGYQFSLRHGHTILSTKKDQAPVFLLFLDCVYQVTRQYPCSFQFNQLFLHNLFVHSYYSSYGTFLYDTPRERRKLKLDEKTQSLWHYLSNDKVIHTMLNPLYTYNDSILILSLVPQNIVLWNHCYLPKVDVLEANNAISSTISAMETLMGKNENLLGKVEALQKELKSLQAVAMQKLQTKSTVF
ncbi:myotubularin-related protein 9-like [Dysidea avara]|uniref:myotubularin-related protein 9-like n=1 Tax=Dysidea avara TaxID=196820 RepID=UPI00331796BD